MFKKKNNPKTEGLFFETTEVKDSIDDLYQGEEKLDRLERGRGERWKSWLASFFSCSFLLGLVFLVGWVIVNRPSSPKDAPGASSSKSLILSIEGPESLYSGERAQYRIKYKNEDKVPLGKMQLIVNYPQGFIFDFASLTPNSNYNNVFDLDDIAPGEEKEVVISGFLVGKKGESKSLMASLSYRPANFNSDFQEFASISTLISEAAVSLTIEGDNQVVPNKELQYKVKVKNNTGENISKLRLVLIYPEGFQAKDFTPQPLKDVEVADVPFRAVYNVWGIDSLGGGQEITFTVSGQFEKSPGEKANFLARAELNREKETYNRIAEEKMEIVSLADKVSLSLVLNGKSGEDVFANLGDKLSYSIIYQNKGDKDLKDVQIIMHLEGFEGEKKVEVVDFNSLESENKPVVDRDTDSLLWTGEEILKLSSFSSQEEGEIDFFIKTFTPQDILSKLQLANEADLMLKSWVELRASEIGEEEANITIESQPINTYFNANVSLDAQVRYFNDDNIAVGSGPVPPKVGEKTTYRIFWYVSRSFHPLEEAQVSAVLPEGVAWEKKINPGIGVLEFDEESRKVVWRIGEIAPQGEGLQADFAVSITPEEKDVNKILALLGKSVFQAIDKKTGKEITASHKALNTDLEDDPTISGRGLVEE